MTRRSELLVSVIDPGLITVPSPLVVLGLVPELTESRPEIFEASIIKIVGVVAAAQVIV